MAHLDHRAVGEPPSEFALQQRDRLRIEVAGGFVEQEDGSVQQEGTGQAESLTLTGADR